MVGLIVANWLGVRLRGPEPGPCTSCSAFGRNARRGGLWAGIAGFLKATVGAHEVISTIMLNWIAIWIGVLARSGPAARSRSPRTPTNPDLERRRRARGSRSFWGEQGFQGLHVGLFVALAAVVVFWALLNRTTLGYEVRAVGFNPDAAAYGGISVKKNHFRAMAISGAFAGLAGTLDMLGGPNYHSASSTSRSSQSGSSASPSRCSAATRRSAPASARSCSGRSLRDFARTADRREHYRPGAREQPHLHHSGTDRPLRRRRRPDPLRLELAQAPAAATAVGESGGGSA